MTLGMVGACSGDDESNNETGTGTGTGTGTATGTGTTTYTTSTNTGTTTTNSGCGSYQYSDVAECQGCLEGSCCAELLACNAGTECAALLDCAEACADTACVDGCAASHQGGIDDAQAFYECMTDSCDSECASGICGSGLVYTDNESLTQCASLSCCASFDPCYDDSACNECLLDPETAGCDTNALFTAYQTCMDANCPTRLCGSTMGYNSWVMNQCVNASCCDEYTPCNENEACAECLADPAGATCGTNTLFTTYDTCKSTSCPRVICTTDIGYWNELDEPIIDCNLCAGEHCCTHLDTCDGDGGDAATDLCLACLHDPGSAECNDTAVHDAAVAFNSCIDAQCATECGE